jgi:hypothetical protein
MTGNRALAPPEEMTGFGMEFVGSGDRRRQPPAKELSESRIAPRPDRALDSRQRTGAAKPSSDIPGGSASRPASRRWPGVAVATARSRRRSRCSPPLMLTLLSNGSTESASARQRDTRRKKRWRRSTGRVTCATLPKRPTPSVIERQFVAVPRSSSAASN